jgi:hypothetical protein
MGELFLSLWSVSSSSSDSCKKRVKKMRSKYVHLNYALPLQQLWYSNFYGLINVSITNSINN